MKTPPSPEFMHALVRREARSLLQYMNESYPWADHQHQEALMSVLRMANHERHQIDRLIRWCIKAKLGNPSLGPYPQSFMSINFMSIEYLLPLLVEDQKKRIADLEWSYISTPHDSHGLIRDLISAKKKHLETLRAFSEPAASSAPREAGADAAPPPAPAPA